VWLTALALLALQLLAVCHTGDRIPGRSAWGSPTTNKHPWTPEGSKGARGLLSVPCRSPVVSIVPACSPDGSLSCPRPASAEGYLAWKTGRSPHRPNQFSA
jgi:hypothetical protein